MKSNFPNRSDITRFFQKNSLVNSPVESAAVNPGALNPPPPPKKLPKVYYRSELDPKARRVVDISWLVVLVVVKAKDWVGVGV